MNGKSQFFQNIEKHILANYRSNGCLSEKIDRWIEKYKEIYEANLTAEKIKLLSLICESILHIDNKDKLKRLIDKYCSLDEMKAFLQQQLLVSNNQVNWLKGQFKNNEMLILKTLSNVFEFLLNEFGIDEKDVYKIQQEGNECVRSVISAYIIEMMKLFYHLVNHDNNNNNNNNSRKRKHKTRHHRQPRPKRQRKGIKDEEMEEEEGEGGGGRGEKVIVVAVVEDKEKDDEEKEEAEEDEDEEKKVVAAAAADDDEEEEEGKNKREKKASKNIKNRIDNDNKSHIYDNKNDDEEEKIMIKERGQPQKMMIILRLIEKFIHDLVDYLRKENVTKSADEIIMYIISPTPQ